MEAIHISLYKIIMSKIHKSFLCIRCKLKRIKIAVVNNSNNNMYIYCTYNASCIFISAYQKSIVKYCHYTFNFNYKYMYVIICTYICIHVETK